MGIYIGRSSYKNYQAPNPNPTKFSVVEHDVVNGKSILLVKYEGCTTFGGLKLLVLNTRWKGGTKLDPHFISNDHCVKARFEPTEDGKRLARLCAREMK